MLVYMLASRRDAPAGLIQRGDDPCITRYGLRSFHGFEAHNLFGGASVGGQWLAAWVLAPPFPSRWSLLNPRAALLKIGFPESTVLAVYRKKLPPLILSAKVVLRDGGTRMTNRSHSRMVALAIGVASMLFAILTVVVIATAVLWIIGVVS
jgi:hypothetical protein